MKHYISLICCLFFANALFSQGVIKVEQPNLTFKNLQADDQPMTVSYTIQNTGNQPVLIHRITPMTSLLTADWPHDPLLPGKSCELKITFTPMQLQEKFNMRILVYSNTKVNRTELTLSGNLVDNPTKPYLLYKYNMNGLRFKNNSINFGKVYTWQTVSDTIEYYNTLKKTVKLGALYDLPYFQTVFIPEEVAPGKKGKIILTLDATKKNDYGYFYEPLLLSVNGEKVYNNRLSVMAELREDFSQLSEQELANAPVATFDKKECNFGEIKPNSKTHCDFLLTNTGKRPLFIRKTKTTCGCTAVTLGKQEVPAGQSTTLRITFDSEGKFGRQHKTITVITNDPKNPETTLTINGSIKK